MLLFAVYHSLICVAMSVGCWPAVGRSLVSRLFVGLLAGCWTLACYCLCDALLVIVVIWRVVVPLVYCVVVPIVLLVRSFASIVVSLVVPFIVPFVASYSLYFSIVPIVS